MRIVNNRSFIFLNFRGKSSQFERLKCIPSIIEISDPGCENKFWTIYRRLDRNFESNSRNREIMERGRMRINHK